MKKDIKNIIINHIIYNQCSFSPVCNLNANVIQDNLDKIIEIIKDDIIMEKVLNKEKDRWLIYKRLGLKDNKEPLSFEDIRIKYGKDINYKYNISPGFDINNTAKQLERKFCASIKKICSYAQKNLNNDYNTINTNISDRLYKDYKTLLISNNKLRNQNMELVNRNKKLEEENELLAEKLIILEEENQKYFLEEVVRKVKKYVK